MIKFLHQTCIRTNLETCATEDLSFKFKHDQTNIEFAKITINSQDVSLIGTENFLQIIIDTSSNVNIYI